MPYLQHFKTFYFKQINISPRKIHLKMSNIQYSEVLSQVFLMACVTFLIFSTEGKKIIH